MINIRNYLILLNLFLSCTEIAQAQSSVQSSLQSYPSRPVRFIVPGPPGSSQEVLARIVGNKLSQQLGQPFVIDARAGASGMIGLDAARAAAPDGYTLLAATSTLLSGLPALKLTLHYDAECCADGDDVRH